MKGKRGRGAICAGSSGLPGRSLQPRWRAVAADHGFDNQDCFWHWTEKWVDHPRRNGVFVAVIAGIVRLVARMARFVIIMRVAVISLPVVLIRCRKTSRVGHPGAGLAMKMELGAQGRCQQQGQRQHSEQEGS